MENTNTNDQILQAISVLQQQAKFPVLVREKIDEWAEQILDAISILEQRTESPLDSLIQNGIEILTNAFLQAVKDSVLHLLCNSNRLVRNRDSEDEIELSIRCFPRVLAAKFKSDKSLSVYNAIMFQAQPDFKNGPRDVNCISFVPLLARLGTELGQFDEDKRGGLLLKDSRSGNNVLQMLAATNLSDHNLYYSEHHQMIDDLYLDAIKRLRATNLFKKEDLRENFVLHCMCKSLVLPNKRFLYLVEWDPTTLSQLDTHGRLPLHYWANMSTILGLEDFHTVLKAGMRHLSIKEGIGFVFYKDNNGTTPFQLACNPSLFQLASTVCRKVEEVTKPIEQLVNQDTLLFAFVNKSIHLDGAYFLLRRQPQLLLRTICQRQGTADLSAKETAANRRVELEQEYHQARLDQGQRRNEREKRKRIEFNSSINRHTKRLQTLVAWNEGVSFGGA